MFLKLRISLANVENGYWPSFKVGNSQRDVSKPPRVLQPHLCCNFGLEYTVHTESIVMCEWETIYWHSTCHIIQWTVSVSPWGPLWRFPLSWHGIGERSVRKHGIHNRKCQYQMMIVEKDSGSGGKLTWDQLMVIRKSQNFFFFHFTFC